MTTDELVFYVRSSIDRPRWSVRIDPTMHGQRASLALAWVECRHDSWEPDRWSLFHPTVEQSERTRLNVRVGGADLEAIERWAELHEQRTGVRLSTAKALVELLRRAKDAHHARPVQPDPVPQSVHADLAAGRLAQVEYPGRMVVVEISEPAGEARPAAKGDHRKGGDRRSVNTLEGMSPELVEQVEQRKGERRRKATKRPDATDP
jgi:hypothetical protein